MADDNVPEFQPVRQYLVSEGQVRAAFVLSFVGMVGLLLLLLVLATARPRARPQALDGQEFRAGLQAATSRLEGYEVYDDGRARLDIDRAIELVAQRGVQDPGIVPPGQAPAGAQGGQAGGEAGAAGAAEQVDGAAAFATCAGCHQANAQGLPGLFPPLAGHAGELYQASRDYPVHVVLFGLMGQIEVDGTAYNGVMPSHTHLPDAEIAAILNHVMTSFGNEDVVESFEPYTAEEVAEQRGLALSSADVYAERQELGLE
ncbi:MAG TPA: cytochrome c [Trueperaceae bacterium]|jgi:mono/diheme cytochrome c family protein